MGDWEGQGWTQTVWLLSTALKRLSGTRLRMGVWLAPGASGTGRMLRLGNGGEALNEKCSGRASAF